MPTPVGHTLGAYSALIAIDPSIVSDRHRNRIALGTAFVFGSLADADFIVEQFSHAAPWKHHYFSHSIPFALLLTLVCFVVLKLVQNQKPLNNACLIGVAYLSHLLLDYFTEDGSRPYGIPLLWPLTDRHFVSPVMIFFSVHRGEWEDLVSLHNLQAMLIEIAVLLPLAVLSVFVALHRNRIGKL